MIICPNFSNPDVAREFEELKQATSEAAAYHIWSLNNGNAIDKAPNGAESKLFLTLLLEFNGDRVKAIQAKAKVYSKSFLEWFGDWTNVDNSETFIFYQGRRSKDVDDRKYNYWTIDEEDAKRNYGQFIRSRRINTKNFLKKHKVVGRHVNPDGTEYYDFAWTDEYKAINEEFKQKYGYKYGFDILDNSKEGLVKQKQFFEFVESKGYSGYREYMKETPENPYVVTFGNTNDAVSKDAVSKVVDENGEPLVVYHGTRDNFTIFEVDKIRTGGGFWFTTQKGEYAYSGSQIAAFLNIRTPYNVISDFDKKFGNEAFEKISQYIKDEEKYLRDLYTYNSNIRAFDVVPFPAYEILDNVDANTNIEYPEEPTKPIKPLYDELAFKEAYRIMYGNDLFLTYTDRSPMYYRSRQDRLDFESRGFDGETDGFYYVVVNPNQIKSATGNIGIYSKEYNEIDDSESPLGNIMSADAEFYGYGSLFERLRLLGEQLRKKCKGE